MIGAVDRMRSNFLPVEPPLSALALKLSQSYHPAAYCIGLVAYGSPLGPLDALHVSVDVFVLCVHPNRTVPYPPCH